jgi:RNA polymerase sigma factor (sigma-70 family)
MAKGEGAVAHYVRGIFEVGVRGRHDDAELVDRLASGGPMAASAAFESLIDRHGPMVLSVARSILRDEHDAADAFQATFIVLIHKAPVLRIKGSLGPWLHQVALRTAKGARAAHLRRRRLDRMVARSPIESETTESTDGRELHEAIARLPARFREVVVLCLVESISVDQVAAKLDIPIGTARSRLARGRDRLRDDLTRRGFAPVKALSSQHPAPVSHALSTATAKFVFDRSTMSSVVAGLARGVLNAMWLANFRLAGLALMLIGVSSAGAVALSQGPSAKSESPQQTTRPSVSIPKAEEPETPPTQLPERPSDRILEEYLGTRLQIKANDIPEFGSARSNAEKRHAVAEGIVQSLVRRLGGPPSGPGSPDDRVSPVLEWSQRRLDARLELCDTPDDQLAVLKQEWKFLRRLERLTQTLGSRAGSMVALIDTDKVTFARLEIERRLSTMLPQEKTRLLQAP